MEYVYSACTNMFYPVSLKDNYVENGMWPSDAILVSEKIYLEFTSKHVDGMIRSAGVDGLPYWCEKPLPTYDEIVAAVKREKRDLTNFANAYINSQQWPSKLMLGRLDDAGKRDFSLWLDYLDAVTAIDVAQPSNVVWPKQPYNT
ncbi:Caudovirales tail fibre assembly protein [Streptococcus pneumoniae]|nr:Caudovirales tail fibre assembly protein [Streptococcus pneumoniae]